MDEKLKDLAITEDTLAIVTVLAVQADALDKLAEQVERFVDLFEQIVDPDNDSISITTLR